MKPHMIFEIVLLALLALCVVALYACCAISSKISRQEEKRDRTYDSNS